MNTLIKHLNPEIKINSRTRMQRMQDRKALVKALSSIHETRNELLMIALFGGSLVALCISLAQTILSSKGL